MRKITAIIAVLMALLFVFAACKPAQEADSPDADASAQPTQTADNSVDEKTVIASISNKSGDTREIYLKDLSSYMENYISNSDNDFYSSNDEETINKFLDQIVEYFVQSKMQLMMTRDLGYCDKLSDDELKQVETQLEAEKTQRHTHYLDEAKYDFFYDLAKSQDPNGDDTSWDSAAIKYKSDYDEETSEYKDQIEQLAEKLEKEYVEQSGDTDEALKAYYTEYVAMQKMYSEQTMGVQVTEDDIKEKYDKYVENDKEYYTDNPDAFESDYLSGVVYYNIPGYRLAKHILIKFDDSYSTKIEELEKENKTDEAKKVKAEAFASIQTQADEVLKKVKAKGADFDALMKEYSQDTGLSSYPNGYVVGKDSTQYDTDFRDAVWALEGEGSISGLVKTSFGYHIIKLEKIIKEGPVDYDSVKDELESATLEYRQSEKYTTFCNKYAKENYTITYNKDSYHVTKDDSNSTDNSSNGGNDVTLDFDSDDIDKALDDASKG